jgi:hypothetical protein
VPTGGTTGQHLKKNSNTNYDTVWSTYNPDWTATSGDAQILNKPTISNYKIYRAKLVSEWDTGLIPIVLENSIGEIVWTDYIEDEVIIGHEGTLTGAFPDANKIFYAQQNLVFTNGDGVEYMMQLLRYSNDKIRLFKYFIDGNPATIDLDHIPFEIYVYP